MIRVHGSTVLLEIDPDTETFKPFSSMDKFRQVHRGESGIKDKCEIESLEKRGADLRDEDLSIGFATPIPPSSEDELLPAPITPVTLPTLRRLTFRGEDVYLNNLKMGEASEPCDQVHGREIARSSDMQEGEC